MKKQRFLGPTLALALLAISACELDPALLAGDGLNGPSPRPSGAAPGSPVPSGATPRPVNASPLPPGVSPEPTTDVPSSPGASDAPVAPVETPVASAPPGVVVGTPPPVVPFVPVVATIDTNLPVTTEGMRDPVGATPAEKLLDLVNQARALAQLAPVALDPALSTASAHHVNYLLSNTTAPWHTEESSRSGYTKDGALAAKNCLITYRDPVGAGLGIFGGVFNRGGLLSSTLTHIGFADGTRADATVRVVAMRNTNEAQTAVAFPASGQLGVPIQYNGEESYLLPKGAGNVGFPATLVLPTGPFSQITGQLFDAAGAEVPTYLLSDELGARRGLDPTGVAAVLAKKPLTPGTTYRVKFTAQQGASDKATGWEWSFTTVKPLSVDAANTTTMRAAVGRLSAVTGMVISGGLTTGTSGSIFLAFTKNFPSHTAFIKKDVWAATGLGDAALLKGKKVTLRVVPELIAGSGNIQMVITAVDQITVGE
ncbi:MAG: hypothetical protein JWM80_4684 [Cyanobacteria bacterium RYN_339]|nr:hypothetical protein [Cyanobacteria bacterium RYN_339]